MKRISKDQILKHLAVAGTCSAAELAEEFGCSISQIHYKCDEMVLDGRLEQAKRPVKVTRVNGRTYSRDAVKVYCIRVQPPVAVPETKLTVQVTPGTKPEIKATQPPSDGVLRAFPAEMFIRPDAYGSVTFPKPVQKDTSINTAIAAIATLRRTLTPDQLSALGVTLADPLADALEEISGEGGFDNFNHQAYRLRSALADKGLEIVERGSHDT